MTKNINIESIPTNYNDKIKPIYSIIFVNVITLGGCALIALFGLDDVYLFFLYWFQIIAANNNQGFLNRVYSYKWRIADVIGAFTITTYSFFYYGNIIPLIIAYPYYIIMFISACAQSASKSMSDYIFLVNIWHLLVFYSLILILYFKLSNKYKNHKNYYHLLMMSKHKQTENNNSMKEEN